MTVRNSIIRQPVKFIYTRTVYRQHRRRVQAGVFAEVGSTNTHFTKRHELIPIPRHPPRSGPLFSQKLYCLLRRRWPSSAATIIVMIAMRSDSDIHVISVMCLPSKRDMPKVTNPIISAVYLAHRLALMRQSLAQSCQNLANRSGASAVYLA